MCDWLLELAIGGGGGNFCGGFFTIEHIGDIHDSFFCREGLQWSTGFC